MAAETIFQIKDARVAGAAAIQVAGADMSMWEYEGTPSHGAVPPAAFANPDNTTQGSLMQTDPAAGKQKWLTALMIPGGWLSGQQHLWDRLLHISGLSGIVTTPQNINGGADATLSRHYVDNQGVVDVGNEIWLEIYTQVGVTATTVTCSYKNESGALHTTQAVTFGATRAREAQRFIQLPLAAGDRGVSAVVSVTVLATTGTAGNFGLVVVHRLVSFVVGPANPETYAGTVRGDIEIMAGACLFWSHSFSAAPTATIPPMVMSCFTFVDK